MDLEKVIEMACPELREITFHSNGRVIAKTGASAKYPKKLYVSKKGETWGSKTKDAILKLIKDNKTTMNYLLNVLNDEGELIAKVEAETLEALEEQFHKIEKAVERSKEVLEELRDEERDPNENENESEEGDEEDKNSKAWA